MLQELRERMIAHLSAHRTCVLAAATTDGASMIPVRYRNLRLEVECLLPRWSDVTYYVEQDPRVSLVIHATDPGALCWLQLRGTARAVDTPSWGDLLSEATHHTRPEELYLVVRVTPQRLELVDESRGWGARETLDV